MIGIRMEETVVGTKEEAEEDAARRLTARFQKLQLGMVARARQLVAV